MTYKSHCKRHIYLILIIIFAISFNLYSLVFDLSKDFPKTEFQENLHTSRVVEHSNIYWLDNPTFEDPIEPTWFSESKGDLSDLNASTSGGQVNFEILGEQNISSNITGTPQSLEWSDFNNSYFIRPDNDDLNTFGCEASHEYQESIDQSRNRPSVHWRKNVTMPVNMSDYVITSATLSSVVNGSADTDLETPNDDLSFDGAGYFATYYDYARFYVKISNLDYENLFEVAYYQTVDLGEGDQTRQATGVISYLTDTFMTVINESILIFYLSKALEQDNYNFGITLGIDIYCEDNYNDLDRDIFYSLLIKSCNLTFTYEKKMNQLTSLSWNQVGDAINGSNIEVTEANLNFKYKISENWLTTLSPNSEIQIIINNRTHSETIKLSSATTVLQEAKIGGFDLIDITPPYENISLSIQVLLADEFGLDRLFVISIDDVYLEISYTEFFPDPIPIPEPPIFWILLIITTIAAALIGSYLVAYQRVLKYPKPVRKVRKYRRTLKSENQPSKPIVHRDIAFNKVYKKELSKSSKLLNIKSSELREMKSTKVNIELEKNAGGGT